MTDRATEMIERVARALYEDQCVKHPDSIGAKTKFYNDGIYHGAARIALAAMREPTEAMLEAEAAQDTGSKAKISGYLDYFSADEVWKAMIDAALGDGECPLPAKKEE